MMNEVLVPARPVPPGRILRRELEARGWTQKEFSEMIRLSEKAISGIVNGSKQVTPEAALKFAAATGTTPEFWINLEANYRLQLARKKCDHKELDAIAERRRKQPAEIDVEESESEDDADSDDLESLETTEAPAFQGVSEWSPPLPAPSWPHLTNLAYQALIAAGLEVEAQQVTERLFAGWLEGHLNHAQTAISNGDITGALAYLTHCRQAVILPARASTIMGILEQVITMLSEQIGEVARIRSGVVDTRSVRYRINQVAEEANNSPDLMQDFFRDAGKGLNISELAQPAIDSLIKEQVRYAE